MRWVGNMTHILLSMAKDIMSTSKYVGVLGSQALIGTLVFTMARE